MLHDTYTNNVIYVCDGDRSKVTGESHNETHRQRLASISMLTATGTLHTIHHTPHHTLYTLHYTPHNTPYNTHPIN